MMRKFKVCIALPLNPWRTRPGLTWHVEAGPSRDRRAVNRQPNPGRIRPGLNGSFALRPVSVVLTSALLLLGGCGYQAAGIGDPDPKSGYQWKSLYREDVQSVAVPVFANRTYRRGLESDLTTSVIQQIEEHSPYKVVPTDRADTILEGVITSADTTTLSDNVYTGLPQEQSYNVTVSFTWKNLRTGQIYTQRRNFDQHTSYFPTLGEDISVGAKDAVQRLATDIVHEMQADW